MVKNVVECEFGVTSAVCDYVKVAEHSFARGQRYLA